MQWERNPKHGELNSAYRTGKNSSIDMIARIGPIRMIIVLLLCNINECPKLNKILHLTDIIFALLQIISSLMIKCGIVESKVSGAK